MKTSDFNYPFNKNLIAKNPAVPRDSSRLMVLDRSTKKITHGIFRELPEILNENYILVMNKTKVYPARLLIQVGNINGELLLLKEINNNHKGC